MRHRALIITTVGAGEMTFGQEYRFATRALTVTRNLVPLKIAIGLLCLSIVVLGTLIQFHPLGPHGLWPRLIHGVLVASALVVGMCWVVLPWPRRRVAIAFVWWADISMVVGACTLSAPASRLGALAHMGLIGVFAAFLLGWRVLAVHCVFATVAIFGLMGWNVRLGEATWFGQYVYSAPALSSVVLLPIIIQVVVEGGRRSLKAISLAAHQDPLTGLLNRRGVQVALSSLLSGQRATRIVAVVLVDVDELKELNDRLGHDAGDESIRAVAAMLATTTRASDFTARMGGDEFMVVGFFDHADEATGLIERIGARRFGIGPHRASVSMGSAMRSTSVAGFDFESLRRAADEELRGAKIERRNGFHAVP